MQATLNVSLLYFHMFAHYSVIYAGMNFLVVPVSQPLSPVDGLTGGVSLPFTCHYTQHLPTQR